MAELSCMLYTLSAAGNLAMVALLNAEASKQPRDESTVDQHPGYSSQGLCKQLTVSVGVVDRKEENK